MGDVVKITVTGMGEPFEVSFRADSQDFDSTFRDRIVNPLLRFLGNVIEERAKVIASQ